MASRSTIRRRRAAETIVENPGEKSLAEKWRTESEIHPAFLPAENPARPMSDEQIASLSEKDRRELLESRARLAEADERRAARAAAFFP